MKTDRIYLFTGTNDHTVVRPIVAAARRFYEDLGVPAEQILYVSDIPAGHAFVTDERGPECDHTGKPYIVDCDYDQAGALLQADLRAAQRAGQADDGALQGLRPADLHRGIYPTTG